MHDPAMPDLNANVIEIIIKLLELKFCTLPEVKINVGFTL